LVATHGSSFPSGHAAHSVIYVWAATTIVVRLRPGMARATLVVVAGVVLTALVGLSRVYLNVHYLSDVSGGWALGAAAFSLCAAIPKRTYWCSILARPKAITAADCGAIGRRRGRWPRRSRRRRRREPSRC
ncbi:MAG TPA: phosphatase PAP2 family protein, partial [Solirubrobacterales bacterium]